MMSRNPLPKTVLEVCRSASNNNAMGVLVTSDGSVTLPGVLLFLGTGLLGIGHFRSSADFISTVVGRAGARPVQTKVGLVLCGLGLALAFLASALGVDDDGREPGSAERRLMSLKYEVMPPKEVLDELRLILMTEKAAENTKGMRKESETESESALSMKNAKVAVCCLSALAMRCGKEQAQRQSRSKRLAELAESRSDPWGVKAAEATADDRHLHSPHELELISQEAAYIVLNLYPGNDATVSSAISLLALVAGDEEVRRRNIEVADKFGLNEPINAMKLALTRSKQSLDPDEDDERLSAELQRKGCLLIGALSDQDKDIATKVVDEDGLIAVFDAMDWYRYHEEVCNWGLWAVFNLCYEHKGNKAELIKLDGIRKICRVMKDCPDSLEVARHGTAIMFDLLREMPETLVNVSEIRRIAVGAGMQDVVKAAMEEFPKSKEIMMMGQQMLVATGFQGEIPHFSIASFTS